MLEENIKTIFMKYPKVLYEFTSIENSNFSNQYKSALVIAVPHDKQLTIENYSEIEFENTINRSKETIHNILKDLEELLKLHNVNYFIPPIVQNNETELVAPFSFKYAAAKSGIAMFLTTILLSAFLLKEKIKVQQITGGFIIIMGIVVVLL